MTHSSSNFFAFLKFAAALGLAVILSSCTSAGLPTGLTARMDQPGATLDRAEALQLINQYRISRGAPVLVADANLNAMAQNLASQYASNSSRPPKPQSNVIHMRLSAGYVNFAETFSGWRGSASDADTIADPNVSKAGLGVAYSANSSYGVHWVLLLGAPQLIVDPPAPQQN